MKEMLDYAGNELKLAELTLNYFKISLLENMVLLDFIIY